MSQNQKSVVDWRWRRFNAVCSDSMAMLKETHEFIELTDGDVVVAKPDKIEIEDKNGKKIERKPFYVDQDASASEKGAYEHYMLKEIDEQPNTRHAQTCNEHFDENGNIKIEADLLKAIEASDRIYIVAAARAIMRDLSVANCLKSWLRFRRKYTFRQSSATICRFFPKNLSSSI